jgi:hypothetical protein
MLVKLIIGEKISFVKKIPATYRKEVEVPFNCGLLYKNGECIGRYQYVEKATVEAENGEYPF